MTALAAIVAVAVAIAFGLAARRHRLWRYTQPPVLAATRPRPRYRRTGALDPNGHRSGPLVAHPRGRNS